MKKIILSAISFIFFSSLVFAELADPHRYFEIGVGAEAGISNNYFGLTEVLVEELVLDLQKISREMPSDGFTLDYGVDFEHYFALDINKNFRFKFFLGLDGTGYANVSHSLFDLLGTGLAIGETKDIKLSIYGDLFLETGFSLKTDIAGFGVRLQPAYFIPLFHVAETSAKLKYTSSKYGTIRADAEVPIDIYSVLDLDDIKNKTITGPYIQDIISEAVKCGGFDLTAEVEHPLTKTFDLGIFTRVPIVPGSLKYRAHTLYWGYAEQTNFLGYLNDTESSDMDYGHEDFTYSSANYKLHRPFILGTEGAWRPFGQWCVIRPKLNLAVRNPYRKSYQVFGEYALSADFRFLKVICFHFATRYENLVFKQVMGFGLNFRVFEFETKVGLRGSDFANSFGMSGATVQLGMKFGF